MHSSRGDSRFWWPFGGLTRYTRSQFSRERGCQIGIPNTRLSKTVNTTVKTDLLQIARQSIQGVPKSEINLSGGGPTHSWRETRFFDVFFSKKKAVRKATSTKLIFVYLNKQLIRKSRPQGNIDKTDLRLLKETRCKNKNRPGGRGKFIFSCIFSDAYL